MFFFVSNCGFWFDNIFSWNINFFWTLDFFKLGNSLVFHELFYQIFVKIFLFLRQLKLSLCLFIPTSKIDYFSMKWEAFFFIAEFQWFFIALSVLPLSCLVKWAHWFPRFLCSKNSNHSSLRAHYSLLMSGLRWLCHLSRHCLPIRPE